MTIAVVHLVPAVATNTPITQEIKIRQKCLWEKVRKFVSNFYRNKEEWEIYTCNGLAVGEGSDAQKVSAESKIKTFQYQNE